MIIGLEWTSFGNGYRTNPQVIAYKNEGKSIIIRDVMFVASSEHMQGEWYPNVLIFVKGEYKLQKTYRPESTQEKAIQVAKDEIECAIGGTFEDGKLEHWTLHGWAQKLVLDKESDL